MNQEEINSLIQSPRIQEVITSEEFYFQKGQGALKKWLEMDVDSELKESLIKFSTDYNQFLEIAELEPSFEKIKLLLFEIISYCDDKARDKNLLNKYDDKRILEKVVENSTNTGYNEYTDQKIESIIGMNGQWVSQGYNNTYYSTARDMARFGLLILNKGKWEENSIISDENYYNQMVNTSQTLNPSYGYLWWLNGKESIIFPSIPTSFNVPMSENAPNDLFAGMGKNGQFVEVIPGKNLVVIRMGEAPDGSLVLITFHNEMWEKINLVMNEKKLLATICIKNRQNISKIKAFDSCQSLCLTESFVLKNRLLLIY